MKPGSKFVAGCAALVICITGYVFYSADSTLSAKVQFSKVQSETNGTLVVEYNYQVPSGTLFREINFINDQKTGESVSTGGNSLLGLGRSGSSKSEIRLTLDPSSPLPDMLVITGKTYRLKLQDRLTIYNFTNKSGTAYRSELSLRPLLRK